jgi:hypothetical protein
MPQDGYHECFDLVAQWKQQWKNPRRPYLHYLKTWESVSIHDGRKSARCSHRFDDKEARLYELCADAKTKRELLAEIDGDPAWLEDTLLQFIGKDLMISMDNKYLSLALPENPYH